jgi:hypothetical protein
VFLLNYLYKLLFGFLRNSAYSNNHGVQLKKIALENENNIHFKTNFYF